MKKRNPKARKQSLKESKYAFPNWDETIENSIRNDEALSDSLKHLLKFYYPNDWQRILKECGIGVLSGVCLAFKSFIIVGLLEKLYDINESEENNPYGYNLTTLYTCILGPALEELGYRAALPLLAKLKLRAYMSPSLAETTAIFGANTLFSLGHANKISSFVSGFFYQKLQTSNKGSLWASTAAHMTHNSLAISGYLDPIIPFVKKIL